MGYFLLTKANIFEKDIGRYILPKLDMNETSDFPYNYFRSEAELRAGVLLWQISSPILIILGTVGNVLSIIVLSQKNLRKSVSTTYLRGLSAADLSVLYVGLLRQWLRYLGYDIRTAGNWICKIHWWFLYVTLDFSVWLLVMVTVERLITTFKPFSNRILCTQKKAKFMIVALGIIVLVINCHVLYGMERRLVEGNGAEVYVCGPSAGYLIFFSSVWNYIDLCKFSLLPFFILVLSNLCIIVKVVSNNRKMKRQVAPSESTTTDIKTKSMSKLLLTLNFVFIVSTAPVCVYLIGEPYWIPTEVPRNIQLEDPWWAVVNILMYLNNTVNFILYCFSGTKFRRELARLFTRYTNQENQIAVNGVNRTQLSFMNRTTGL